MSTDKKEANVPTVVPVEEKKTQCHILCPL